MVRNLPVEISQRNAGGQDIGGSQKHGHRPIVQGVELRQGVGLPIGDGVSLKCQQKVTRLEKKGP